MLSKEIIRDSKGWLFMAVLAALCSQISLLVEIGGKHPIEASVIAILTGVLLRNNGWIPSHATSGIKSSEKLLVLGIVLMGASMDLTLILNQGGSLLAIIIGTMLIGYSCTYFASRMFSLSPTLSTLLAVGTTICGGTAIAITAPLIGAREEETSYAVATISLWGLIAILLYPEAASQLGASDTVFGIFAGTAIHSTPQVVGAAFVFSEAAGKTATAVKLVRNCFIAPCALIVSAWRHRSVGFQQVLRAFPWFLFGFFILSGMRSFGLINTELGESASSVAKFLILVGMVGVGLNTDLRAMRQAGVKPLIVGLIGTVIVAASSLMLIRLLHPN